MYGHVLQDTKTVSMESLEEPVLLEEQTTRSETPTAAWPEQKKGIAVHIAS